MEAALAGEMSAGPNYRGEKPRATLISGGMWTQSPGSGIIRRARGAGENRRCPAVAPKRPARAGICAGGGAGKPAALPRPCKYPSSTPVSLPKRTWPSAVSSEDRPRSSRRESQNSHLKTIRNLLLFVLCSSENITKQKMHRLWLIGEKYL